MAASPWGQPIRRPWAGIYLLGLIVIYNILFQTIGMPFNAFRFGFWCAIAAFWIIPLRWVPYYLMVAGTLFATITGLIIFSHHKPETFGAEVALSTGAAILMFLCAALAMRSQRSKTPLS
jgi:hypothetical protein